MNADCFFTIGKTHKICEDYIHTDQAKQSITLCDGCSSAEHSDVGARILAHSYNENRMITLLRAGIVCDSLKLSRDSLCATLINATVKNSRILVTMIGDGVIISREASTGNLEIFDVNFKSGAPVYLKYFEDRPDGTCELDDYFNHFGDIVIENDVEYSFKERYQDGIIRKEYAIDKYDLVAIFSDGIHSFRRPANNSATAIEWESIPLIDIANEVLAFKGYTGAFVHRRCNKAFEKFGSMKWQNLDDFSMGVIKV